MSLVVKPDETEASASEVPVESSIKLSLTQREQEVLMAAWLSIKGAEPQVDYDSLAKILGLKNAHSANTVFYNVRKKIKQFRGQAPDGQDDTPTSPAPKKVATPRKRKPAAPRTPRSAKRAKQESPCPAPVEEPIVEDGAV